uniref:uncharacterized protein LOC122584960 n=1 Tax=Erigeron canadensis TaxID=72917 RepID=UPI001CB94F0A|nr:uncharacterized protein LOC122584960 [Erigeron canadensis]
MVNTPPTSSSFYEDVEEVQETQPEVSVSSPQKEKRKHRKKETEAPKKIPSQVNWSEEESLALCRSWVDVSEDPKCANYQKARTFWLKIQEGYHKILKRPTYRGIESLHGKWRKIRTSVTMFNGIITRLSGSGYQSGSSQEDLISNAVSEYNAQFPIFKFLKEWQCLRRSSKWEVIDSWEAMSSPGEPSSKRSKTTSESSGQQSVGSSARVAFDLNDTYEGEPQPQLSRLGRPVGRDTAKKAGRGGGGVQGRGRLLRRWMWRRIT